MEDFAFILDYLPQGPHDAKRFKREPIAYALGETEFKILELIPKPNVALTVGEKVYIGKDMEQREKILHVKRRINYKDLTNAAQSEILYILEDIVKNNKARFLKFFNEAGAISTRFHTLELLPGLGKKTMWAVLEERKKKAFESFEDIEDRVSQLHNPEKLIVKRIEMELSDPNQKYRLFVAR